MQRLSYFGCNMTDERKTDPSGLLPPGLPPGVIPVPQEVLDFILGELKGIHVELASLRGDVVGKLRQAEARITAQVKHCHKMHDNGEDPRPPWEP